jgi:hypothetical protein
MPSSALCDGRGIEVANNEVDHYAPFGGGDKDLDEPWQAVE